MSDTPAAKTSFPLSVSENGRHFVDADDTPFFWLADTAWALFAQYDLELAERYLTTRARQGFNVVKGVLVWNGGTFMEKASPHANYRGDHPWFDGNPTTPNPAYFDHVAHLLDIAASVGLTLNMLPVWGYHVSDAHLFDVEKARAYGLWLGQRFRDFPNIVWTLGGDRNPQGYEDIYRAMAAAIIEATGGIHLMSYHPAGGQSSARYFHNEGWLDFNVIQTWSELHRIYPTVITDVVRTPCKPVVMDEGAYEAGPEYPLGPITPLLVRRQAWWTVMAGGFHTYGHNDMWRVEPGWIDSLASPGANQMTIFKSIVTSRRWWEMSPCPCLISDGASSGKTINVAMRTQDCSCGMIYLSTQCHVRISTGEINSQRVQVAWVNPATGEQQDAGLFERGDYWFTTPDFWEDAVLILDAVA